MLLHHEPLFLGRRQNPLPCNQSVKRRLCERTNLCVARFIRLSLQTSDAFALAFLLHRLRMIGMGRVVVIMILITILISISISATATTQLLLTGQIDDTSRLLIAAAAGYVGGLVCVDVVNKTLIKPSLHRRFAWHNDVLLLAAVFIRAVNTLMELSSNGDSYYN